MNRGQSGLVTRIIQRLDPYLLTTLCICLFLVPISNYAEDRLTIEYSNGQGNEYINLRDIDGISFFSINELNKAFNAFISTDIIDGRVFIDIYDQRLVFLIETSYMVYQSDIYSFIHSMRNIDGNYYLPAVFLKRLMPKIMPDKISYVPQRSVIRAQPAVDTSFRTIVIDPGHGGRDPGALSASGQVTEKEIVLAVSKIAKEIIEKNLDIEVLLTREDDRFMPLQERTAFANDNDANIFVSIHANAAPRSSAHGVEVYFLSAARTDEARAVEIIENSVVAKYEGEEAVKQYDDLTFILMDMAQAEQLKESSYLAIKLQANLVEKTGGADRGVRQAGFYVLRGAYMPSVLVELGFLSNPTEERKLRDTSYQRKLAEAIYEGVKSYMYNYEMFR